ncbi:DUF481 domain-containing protein [Edaphobacter aggregans]|uniref:DUF481 domain-containing protein n=1 Tax=Edaphobacter aggregans TaxID=570835 RepID=UPI0005520BDC|nr:DUF481 domain-containing protein [Edaphobacter aggregans]
MLKKLWAALLAAGLGLLIPEHLFAGTRTSNDIVYMRNGDRITCEIKSLSQGQLTVKPGYSNSAIVLDWTKVDRIQSAQQFLITDPDGKLYDGSLAGESGSLVVKGNTTNTLNPENVIQIDQLGTTFLRRFRGDADVGTSFARSNSQQTLTLQTDLGYQSASYIASINSSSQFASQQETNDTNETTLKSQVYRQLGESNWYSGGLANFLSSTEQQISLRSTLGAAITRRQIFTNKTNLNFVGGLAYTNERDSGNGMAQSRKNALDSVFATQYSTFRFDSMTFNTSFWLYPSITSAGRVRFTLNQDVYYKFFSDFYIRFSFYDNYDNRPVVGTPSNNLGGTTSFGWSFH